MRLGKLSWQLALALVPLVALAAAVPATAGPSGPSRHPAPVAFVPTGHRTTGASLAGFTRARIPSAGPVSAAEAAPSPLPSTRGQIAVLKAALKKMEDGYSSYLDDVPGPSDILDYGIGPLWLKGIDGAGTTIALLEGWNLPGIGAMVASFDKIWGLPNPVITTIYPSGDGKLPSTCPAGMVALGDYGSCQAWGGELELDVLSAHLIAPYARILLSVTPADSQVTDDGASQVAPYEMMQALEVIAARHLANVVSVSTGTAESSYIHGTGEIMAQNPGLLAAAVAGIPICEGSGDRDVLQALPSLNGDVLTKTPDTAAWDDSPWVTAVGGTVPNLSDSGARLGPDPIWNVGSYGEGAGYSSVFSRPIYQSVVVSITHSPMRSVPDITMDARDGTSEAGPLLAGVLALATQMNKANVGPINPALYDVLGPKGEADGIADVVSGNNTYTPASGKPVPGFSAAKGFDVASGWGTIYAPKFLPALVAATKADHDEAAWRQMAASELTALRHDLSLSVTNVPTGGTSYLLAGGFLPGHPIELLIGARLITTLKASPLGKVTYMIDPSLLKLARGGHNIELKSMLIDETSRFSSH